MHIHINRYTVSDIPTKHVLNAVSGIKRKALKDTDVQATQQTIQYA